jgi:diguanylate cyclase (GGDEF)-like protein
MARTTTMPSGRDPGTKPRLGIRLRLIIIALLAVIPLSLDRVRVLEATRSERTEMAHATALDFARRSAEAQLEIVNSTRAVLQVIARAYMMLRPEGRTCTDLLAGFADDVRWVKGFSVVDADGRIVCTSRAMLTGLSVSDRDYVKKARESWDFVLSDYLVERAYNQPAIMAAYPVFGPGTSPYAIILASIDLEWIGRIAAAVGRQTGAAGYVIDGRGTVLASFQEHDELFGKRFADHPLIGEVLSRWDGTATTLGLDGIRRIVAYMRLPGTDARIVIGLDEREVLSRIDRELRLSYLQLVLFCCFTVIAVWYGGERLIVRPLRALARAAGRIGRGEMAVDTSPRQWAAEIAPLATALSDMAKKLAAREHDLRSANRQLEELATIDSLSGLANRRGFDAKLHAEWHKAAELKQPLALLMIDVDHFKLFNDHHGHIEGDQCLRIIGDVLTLLAEAEGFAARYGGEEFALLLPNTDAPKAVGVAELLRLAVAELRIPHAGAPLGHVTLSIGVAALVPAGSETAHRLVASADAALCEAKRRGRNTVATEPAAVLEKGVEGMRHLASNADEVVRA